MIFEPTPVPGAFIVRPEAHVDERGSFARLWCRDEFAAHGIEIDIAQASQSRNAVAGTLRGLHYTRAPAREAKLVRCERGRVFDVIVDLRPASPAFLHHVTLVLSEDDPIALFIPQGVAHGFQTLVDDSTVVYMMSEAYRPELAAGARYDDLVFGIGWPRPVTRISERDRSYPDFVAARHDTSAAAEHLAATPSR